MSQGRTKGKGWSTANWLKPSNNFIAGRSKAALWFFRCGVWLFIVLIDGYKTGKNVKIDV